MAAKGFFDAVRARRSFYPLQASSPIPDSRIREIIEQAYVALARSLCCGLTRPRTASSTLPRRASAPRRDTSASLSVRSFNSQTTRVLILFGDEHRKLWDFTHDAVKAVAPADVFEKQTAPKLQGFRGAYGTALFFVRRIGYRTEEGSGRAG
jgi:predicted oxidoreductase (fatty acid repression mutant protein)